MQSEMKIVNYESWVSLGCSKEEQSLIQPVHFNIEILFSEKVLAETTDQLQDSIDYVKLTDLIKKTATEKSYSMIEHLCFSVTQKLKSHILAQYKGVLTVQALKLRAPVENLRGGVQWTCKTIL